MWHSSGLSSLPYGTCPCADPLGVALVLTEADIWNPDGSPPADLNPLIWALQLTPTAVSESLATP